MSLNGTDIKLDNEGYLLKTDDWSPELAEQLACEEDMELTAARLEIVHLSGNILKSGNVSRNCAPC